ncbi:RNA polymerase subunit sigma-24 [Streptomyces sp. NBC_00433]
MSGRKRSQKKRAQPTPHPASRAAASAQAAGSQAEAAARRAPATATTPAPPPGHKSSRPRKPGPSTGRPGTPPPAPMRVRVVYRPVAATVLPAEEEAADPEGAFDALYLRSATALRRQVAVLTGDRKLAARAVQRAFDLAWRQWPEVARDSDPVGWVRAAAHNYALAPWQRALRGRGPGRHKAVAAAEDALPRALVRLHPERRRALLLHDGLGLSLRVTAAEVESSTTAVASRIIGARRELAAAAPDDYDGGDAAGHLTVLLAAEPDPPAGEPEPRGVRKASERGTRRRTVGVLATVGAIALATTVGMIVLPQHGTPPRHGPAHEQQAARPSANS